MKKSSKLPLPSTTIRLPFRFNLIALFLILFLLPLTPVEAGYGGRVLEEVQPLYREVSLKLPEPASYPVQTSLPKNSEITAQGAIVVDLVSQKVLYEKNADLNLYPASTTKIMTALVALEKMPLDQNYLVQRDSVEGNNLKFKKGDSFTLTDLVKATLIFSANDAAVAIADNYPGGTVAFVTAMNAKAAQLNLDQTHFSNPIGLHQGDHFSSARDLARMTTQALKNPIIKLLVATKKTTITNLANGEVMEIENLNQLLGQGGVDGVKTGFTQEAGGCLVASSLRNGHKIITVVLNSQDRFLDTQRLLASSWSSYRWDHP